MLSVVAAAAARPALRHFGRAQKLTIMGLGGLGTRIQCQLQECGYGASHWVWDTATPDWEHVGSASVVLLPGAALDDARANIVLPHAVHEALRPFGQREDSSVLLVAGLGGATGSRLVGPLMQLIEERCRTAVLVASLPARAPDGPQALLRACTALADCTGSAARLAVTSGEGAWRLAQSCHDAGAGFHREMETRLLAGAACAADQLIANARLT